MPKHGLCGESMLGIVEFMLDIVETIFLSHDSVKLDKKMVNILHLCAKNDTRRMNKYDWIYNMQYWTDVLHALNSPKLSQ